MFDKLISGNGGADGGACGGGDGGGSVLPLIAALGIPGYLHPEAHGVVEGEFRFPAVITDGGTTQVVSGQSGAWKSEPSLAQSVDQNGNYSIFCTGYRFEVDWVAGADPEIDELQRYIRSSWWTHQPQNGAARRFAAAGHTVVTASPVAVAQATPADAVSGFVHPGEWYRFAVPRRLEISNDQVVVTHGADVSTGAGIAYHARLVLRGVAVNNARLGDLGLARPGFRGMLAAAIDRYTTPGLLAMARIAQALR